MNARQLLLLLGIFVCHWSSVASAKLELVTNAEPQCVFCDRVTPLAIVFHNAGNQAFSEELHTRLYQTSSTTAAWLKESPWKKLSVWPGQTLMESASMDFPTVRAETRFLVQWLDTTNQVIGQVPVLVYPPHLLAELRTLAGAEPLAVFDPENRLKPLLKESEFDFVDLEDSGFKGFSASLAIVGPCSSKARVQPAAVRLGIIGLAKKGVAVVWLQGPPEGRDKLMASFCTVTQYPGAVVVVQAEMVAHLAENPQAQLNLVQFARMAVHPEPLRLPGAAAPAE